MGTGAAVDEVGVVTQELRRRKRAEDELAIEAEEIEGASALDRIEGSERRPSLVVQHVGLEGSAGRRVDRTGLRVAHRVVGELAGGAQIQRAEAITDVGIRVLHEPVRQLHDVAVGVVERASLRVGHARDGSARPKSATSMAP